MRNFLLIVLLCIFSLHLNAQTTTFDSPGQQACTTTNTELAAVTASDGVTIKPYLRLEVDCLDDDLSTFSLNSPAAFRKPTFCYNNGYYPTTSGYPLAIARNSTANGGVCNGGRSNVVADFTTSSTRPQGLTFSINDVDNSYDSIEVKVYSNSNLVPYTFVFGDPNTATSYAWSNNTTGSGTVVQFNGGANGVWGESNGWNYNSLANPPQVADQFNAQGTIYFTVDPFTYVDSVVMTHIIRGNRGDINAAQSIGDFKWTTITVLSALFGEIYATIGENGFSVSWQTLSEKNNDHFEVQVSEDGKKFKTIATVKSKAENNLSDSILSYEYNSGNFLNYAFAGVYFIAFLVLIFASRKRNKWATGLTLLCLIMAIGISCNKKGSSQDLSGKKDVFVRILQVDMDGSVTPSKVIKAVHQ